MLLRKEANFDLAVRFRAGKATLGEVFAFISGLYFRGKLAYGERFGTPLVIVPGRGLLSPSTILTPREFYEIGDIDVASDNPHFRQPLLNDAARTLETGGSDAKYILLGSIATKKYTDPLLSVFGERLLFPIEFVGRGDMSRGGLLLRRVAAAEELSYVAVLGTKLQGQRPGKLPPV
ncbi:MAG: hypothetical protein ABIQ44_02185 [Chloroflexia bacterium]